jgi:transposase-like protein
MALMPQEQSAGKPTTRRYSQQEKAAAVGMVRTLRAETGSEHGAVKRVADQLGYGVESVRQWVRQADIDDGHAPGLSTEEAARVRELEQEDKSWSEPPGPTHPDSGMIVSATIWAGGDVSCGIGSRGA